MKKALSLVLTMCIVLSLFATFVVSASAEEAVNLAAGLDVANQENMGTDITELWIDTDLTDGVVDASEDFANGIKWTTGQWFGYWYNSGSTVTPNSPNGVAIPTVDLGKACSIESARVHVYLGSDYSGIVAPKSVALLVSDDGETYTEVGKTAVTAAADTKTQGWVEVALETAVEARYVRIAMEHGGYWLFIDELEVYGTEIAAAPVLTWQDGWVNDPADDKPEENGQDLIFNNAYDYTFNINYVDGVIAGEDNTLITNQEKYLACNPNWAVSVLLAPTATAGTYEVVTVVMNPGDVAKNGLPEGINFDNGNIVLVAHSAYSNDLGTNYTSKLCALALKVGDKVVISEDKTTAYVPVPGGNEPEVIVETITVDGDLTDTGWNKDMWTTVNDTNGYWQSADSAGDTLEYKYQIRADENKVYVAVEVNETKQVRFWVRDDATDENGDPITVYTHFYDVVIAEADGQLNVTTTPRYNTSTTENKGNSTADAPWTDSSFEAKVTKDGNYYVEMSFDINEFAADGEFEYYICVFDTDSNCLFSHVVPVETEEHPLVVAGKAGVRLVNLPYNIWYSQETTAIDVEAVKLGEVVVGGETDDDLGDAGIYAIAALAIVALIGTAVVIKKRA